MDEGIRAAVTVAIAIVGLATLAVLVSSRAQTTNVIGATGQAFSQSLLSAEAPVIGNSSAYGGYGAPFSEAVPLF